MASINGLSVNGLTRFAGHEGETRYQGNLYLGTKKLGFWSQDGWGGPDRYRLEGKYSERLLNEAVKRANPDKAEKFGDSENGFVVEYDLDLLLNDFIVLQFDEKEFKKAVKAGYGGIVIATDGYHVTIWKISRAYAEMADEKLLETMASYIDEAKADFFKETGVTKHVVKIYRSLGDFAVGEPIAQKDIMV